MINRLEKAFCRHSIAKFSVVVFDNQIKKHEYGYRIVLPFSESKRLYGPFGLSLYDVVDLDTVRQGTLRNEVQKGGLIEVVVEGEFIEYFDRKLQLPYRQPVYINPETDRVTWKKIGPEVGYIVNHDDNGLARVYFNGDK